MTPLPRNCHFEYFSVSSSKIIFWTRALLVCLSFITQELFFSMNVFMTFFFIYHKLSQVGRAPGWDVRGEVWVAGRAKVAHWMPASSRARPKPLRDRQTPAGELPECVVSRLGLCSISHTRAHSLASIWMAARKH